jgi:hypothetical protein
MDKITIRKASLRDLVILLRFEQGIIYAERSSDPTGKGETLIPAVNPISYAMMGLLPQMHRDEVTISKIVSILLKPGYGIDYIPKNIPCKYLGN